MTSLDAPASSRTSAESQGPPAQRDDAPGALADRDRDAELFVADHAAWFRPGPRQAWVEIALLWLGLPLAVVAYRLVLPDARAPIIPLVVLAAIGGTVLLWRDPTYHLGQFFDAKPVLRAMRIVLPRFVLLGGVMYAFIHLFFPANLFEFPKARPDIWVFVMIAYPIVSVFAQGVVYRGVFLHRYRGVFGRGPAMLVAGTVIFAFAHVVMLEWIAVAMTLIGGLLFTSTQLKHRSLLASGIEHALYGCWAFTVGYGQFLYAGSRQAAEQAAHAAGG